MISIPKHKMLVIAVLALFGVATFSATAPVSAGTICGKTDNSRGITEVSTSIDIGCKHEGNPITDATFGVIRFLSNGVGLVLVGSMVYAGMQYSASRGDPQKAAQAITRIQSNVLALFLYIFSYAILNYLLPAGFVK